MITFLFALSLACAPVQMPADGVVKEALAGNLPQDRNALELIFGFGRPKAGTVPSVDGTTSYRVVADPTFDQDCFQATVDAVLLDPRSWPGMRPVEPGETPQVWVVLTRPADSCGGGNSFSYHCAWPSGPGQGVVTVNYQRWERPINKTHDPFELHAQVINHEVGHLLGFDHTQCSVMGGPGYGEWAECPLIVWPSGAEQLEVAVKQTLFGTPTP